MHHNRKADAPSGTCIKTAELMEELGKSFNPEEVDEHESLGCRGGQRDSGLRLHSVRLLKLVAHQEVMFGAPGETYCVTARSTVPPTCLVCCSRCAGAVSAALFTARAPD